MPETGKSPKYQRILLKLSGEALMGQGKYGIEPATLQLIAAQVREVAELGVQVGVVIGGGNIFRGISAETLRMDRASADYMGMLATCINSLALQGALEAQGAQTRVLSAIEMNAVAEPYIRRRALRHLEKGRVVIFAAGTGNPYFTTDTAAALRGMEVNAEVIIKGTQVDGVYTDDPKKNPDARRFDRLSYSEAIEYRVRVMDLTAITLCMDHKLPLIVLNIWDDHSLQDAVLGKKIGTLIDGE